MARSVLHSRFWKFLASGGRGGVISRVSTQDADRLGLCTEFFERVGNGCGIRTADEIQIEEIFEGRPAERTTFDLREIDTAFGEWPQRMIEGARSVADAEHDSRLVL